MKSLAEYREKKRQGLIAPSVVGGKFSKRPLQIGIKGVLKSERIQQGIKMTLFAKAVGISRKQLEDFETTRDYGSHYSVEMLVDSCDELGLTVDSVIKEALKAIKEK